MTNASSKKMVMSGKRTMYLDLEGGKEEVQERWIGFCVYLPVICPNDARRSGIRNMQVVERIGRNTKESTAEI